MALPLITARDHTELTAGIDTPAVISSFYSINLCFKIAQLQS